MENQPREPLPAPSAPRSAPPLVAPGDCLGAQETPLPGPNPPVKPSKALQVTVVTENLDGRPKVEPPKPAPIPDDTQFPTLSDFRFLEKVGEGAIGCVYRAYQISAEREVAVKVLFPHLTKNAKILERFYREARIMGLLAHPGIVQAYGVSEENGLHYLAMEFVDGQNLEQWVERLGKFSVGDALYVIVAAARALKHAHDLDLVHRDIKPENIIITHDGIVKVGDFGMVKLIDENLNLTQTGYAVGTPCYMPLEQARNAKDSDGRSDIYALGCTLYCLLTGQPPFTGPTIVELIQAKAKGTFPPARKANSSVPDRLDLIIGKMVAKSLDHRYQTCEEVIRDLENLNLTSSSLSFLGGNGGASAAPGPAVPEIKAPKVRQSPASSSSNDEAIEADWWYVRFRNHQGQMLTRKLTTPQVLELIEDKDFDVTAQASHNLHDGYASLACIREFKDKMVGRVTKISADKRTERYRMLYEKIEKATLERREGRKVVLPPPGEAIRWKVVTFWLAVLGFGSLVIFLLFRFIIIPVIEVFTRQ